MAPRMARCGSRAHGSILIATLHRQNAAKETARVVRLGPFVIVVAMRHGNRHGTVPVHWIDARKGCVILA